MAKNPYEDWQTFPLADQLGILGDEELASQAVGSAPTTVGDLITAGQTSYADSAGSIGRTAPATINLGTLPELQTTKTASVEPTKPEPVPTQSTESSNKLFNPNGSILPSRIQAVGDKDPAAFIVHHTSGRGTVDGVVSTLKERHLGVQYVMDRDGNISATGGPGAANIRTGWGPKGKGLSNQNIVGMEIIANDDKDVTDAQKQSFAKFIQARYPTTQLLGHGEVNPGHKEADEGISAKTAALALRSGSTPSTALAATPGATPPPSALAAAPRTTTSVATTASPTLGTVRAKSEWLPGEPKTRDTQYGALMENGQAVKLGMSDIAMSPNLLKKHGLKLGDKVDVLDKEGKVVYPGQRIADLSYFSPNKPTTDTIELWGRPDIGSAQIRKAGDTTLIADTKTAPKTDWYSKDLEAITPDTIKKTAETLPALAAPPPVPEETAKKAPALALSETFTPPWEEQQKAILAARARLKLPKFV